MLQMVFEDYKYDKAISYHSLKAKVEARLGMAPGTLPDECKFQIRELFLEFDKIQEEQNKEWDQAREKEAKGPARTNRRGSRGSGCCTAVAAAIATATASITAAVLLLLHYHCYYYCDCNCYLLLLLYCYLCAAAASVLLPH